MHAHEGTINQFLGDGFMALFGAPIAHEDHARRALAAGIGLRRRVDAQQWNTGRSALQLSVRIGLNTGAVVVGKIGDNLRMDYTAVGDTTNVAARIQAKGVPGQVVASEATIQAAHDYIDVKPLGPHALKGKSESVVLYEVQRLRNPTAAQRIGSPKSILPSLGETRRFQSFKGILLVCKPDAAVSSCYWANRVWASRVYWPKCEGAIRQVPCVGSKVAHWPLVAR